MGACKHSAPFPCLFVCCLFYGGGDKYDLLTRGCDRFMAASKVLGEESVREGGR